MNFSLAPRVSNDPSLAMIRWEIQAGQATREQDQDEVIGNASTTSCSPPQAFPEPFLRA
jgi:hypothetical protein